MYGVGTGPRYLGYLISERDAQGKNIGPWGFPDEVLPIPEGLQEQQTGGHLNVVPIQQEPPAETEAEVSFPTFYTIYARKEARKDAKKAWDSLSPADQHAAILGAAAWRRIHLERGCQYVPLPATWLRGERWQDELPREYRATSSSHLPAQSTPLPPRGSLPPEIVALFAKLKGQK